MYPIKGRIQHYAWGGKTFISKLLGQDNKENLPYAEYWLGVHPGGVSEVDLGDGARTNLNALLVSDKKTYLGPAVLLHFTSLPFLLKVLDVEHMLSIQVHPTIEAATKGFAKEYELGIPLDASNRNYKDQNHKPEIMVALSEFWLLHGFATDILDRLNTYSFLQSFLPAFEQGGLASLYSSIMIAPQNEIEAILKPLGERIIPSYQRGELKKEDPDFWAARALIHAPDGQQYDRGIFSIYLFNIVKLMPGQGIFQGAGMPHAYLEGQNIELMSNSDNVLRAGLTPKYIDIPELLLNTQFVETTPHILEGNLNDKEINYPTGVLDFGLRYFHLQKGETIQLKDPSPTIVLILEGNGIWKGRKSIATEGFSSFYTLPMEAIEGRAEFEMRGVIARVGI